MFQSLGEILKTKDLRRRILYVFMMAFIIRLIAQIPVPGVKPDFFTSYFGADNDALGFLNAFTGGGFENFSIISLSITPYITSSIVLQLLTIAFPKLEEIAKDGEEGREKMAKYTRRLTVGLSLMEATAMCVGFRNQMIINPGILSYVTVILALTAGSCVLVWFGDQITEKGVGNGISMVLLINILSRVPGDLYTLFKMYVSGKNIAKGGLSAVIILAIILATIVLTLVLNGAERRIPVQYSKKMSGRHEVGGGASDIPMKVNTAGVIPMIFASSLMSFPGIICTFMGKTPDGVPGRVLRALSTSSWFNLVDPVLSLGVVLFGFLMIFFAYFYTEITFNPIEIADTLKKRGGMIPGIRPGKPTERYLSDVLRYVVFIGAVGLLIICLIPIVANGLSHASISFGGTSLMIISSVILEDIRSLEASLRTTRASRSKGFLIG